MIPKEDIIGFFKACYDDSEPDVHLDDFNEGPLYKSSMIPWRRSIIQHSHPLHGKYWPRPMGFEGISRSLDKLSRVIKDRCSFDDMMAYVDAIYDSSIDRIEFSETGFPVKITALHAIQKAMGDTSIDPDLIYYMLSELATFIESQMLL